MFFRRFLILPALLVHLLGAAACMPDLESLDSALELSSGTEAAAIADQAAASSDQSATDPVQDSGVGIVVDVTPMSDAELAAQPPGQSEPGAAEGGGPQTEPGGQGERTPSATNVVYSDTTYKFSVAYPSDFVFDTLPAEKLDLLTPRPIAGFIFMNPLTASSDVVELEPADLEVRVHEAGQIASLDTWLTSNALVPADGSAPPKPFQTPNVSGVQVCASTMIAPGCSYYVIGGGWIYQLTPASLDGEAIVNTFTLIP
jgi:hypothetical protein